MSRKHHLLSASGAPKWTKCTKSIHMEMGEPDTTSEAAEQGTVAHDLSEWMLKLKTNQVSSLKAKVEISRVKAHKLFNAEMDRHMKAYVAYVLEAFSQERAISDDAEISFENELDVSPWIDGGFCHLDVEIIRIGKLRIIDLKYGKGVPVFAENNEQLMIYALGAWLRHRNSYPIHTVEISIYQPRVEDGISTWVIPVKQLLKWGEEFLKPQAIKAANGTGEFAPGEKQCKFCKAKGYCRALAQKVEPVLNHSFETGDRLTDAEVSKYLGLAPLALDWLKGLKEYALTKAIKEGKQWPDWKLAHGRSNRQFTDEQRIIRILNRSGLDEEDYINKQLIGITAMQELLGEKGMYNLIGKYIKKGNGAATLVPINDKRATYNSAKAAFSHFTIED